MAWLHFPFPNHCAQNAVLPGEVVQASDAAYRDRLAAAIPEAGSDQEYDAMVAVGLAAALVVRTHRLRLLASGGRTPYDSWRRRTQSFQQIQVFVDRCASAGHLPDLADWFSRLAAAMVDRWADAGTPPAPLFPAFSGCGRPAP